tara:strand:- start:46 stop:1155 length:1110 start_codon:yes stop_codon:yes gene_type:complete
MAFKMKNPSIMKMAKAAGDNRVAMKMKNEAAMQMKKQAAMKMKDPMDMKKDPMMMKKDSAMNMGHSPKKMKARAAKDVKKGSGMKMKKDLMDSARADKAARAVGGKKRGAAAGAKASRAEKAEVGKEAIGARVGRAAPVKRKEKLARPSGSVSKGKSPMKATYAEALKKDSNLKEYIAKRKTLTKGTPEWNANQNKINAAYGVSKRYPTGGSSGGGKANTSGIKTDKIINDKNTRSGTKTRGAAIGNKKVIQTTYDDGTRRQETKVKGKSAVEGKKIKQRNYDEKGNLTSKTKEKYRKKGGGGEGMADDYYKGRAKKTKTTTKDASTVTKTKTKFNKDGSVKAQVTRSRKRRFVGLGKLLAGKRAGQRT